jgi:hypothetical protein
MSYYYKSLTDSNRNSQLYFWKGNDAFYFFGFCFVKLQICFLNNEIVNLSLRVFVLCNFYKSC